MKTYFFYDLETSGLSARDDRVMQFAGQRTDMDLKPVGDPYNILVKLNDDTLPSPEAVMVTGITPQSTQADGYSEAEFAKLLITEVFTEDTITVGFNNIRFDDEFIRHLLWRNFYDPYEWAWKNGRSRWDLLDVVRMTRALRPDGIEWPFDDKGNPTNRLELLTKVNGIEHTDAHDALADVEALIAITKLIESKQPQLYEYMLSMREKKSVQKLVNLQEKQPFVYVSGRYDAAHQKATIAFPLTSAPNNSVLVYDLRYDPTPFLELSVDELSSKLFAPWEERSAEGFVKIPVKTLQHNRAPAVAPIGVLQQSDGWKRIGLELETVEQHKKLIISRPDFAEKLRTVFEKGRKFAPQVDAEAQLYDGFLNGTDTVRVEAVRNASSQELVDFHPEFQDERLSPLLLHYKARSFPNTLTEDEAHDWEQWRSARLQRQVVPFLTSLQKIAANTNADDKQFLLQELQLWAEAIMPAEPNGE